MFVPIVAFRGRAGMVASRVGGIRFSSIIVSHTIAITASSEVSFDMSDSCVSNIWHLKFNY